MLIVHSKKPLLQELQNLVTPNYAVSWKEVGLQLGIQKGILQSIEINFPTDVEERCNEMFVEWLNTDVAASWAKLIEVIFSPVVLEIIDTFIKSPLKYVKKLECKLKARHTDTRYKSTQDDWFSEPEHFTSVALIHQKKHKTRKEIIEFATKHQKGDFSGSGKVTTDIGDIFASVECTGHPYILLIEGAPGIGKTILSKEIVFQWAKENLLKKERLVFLIYLRDPRMQTVDSFESFIAYITYSSISKDIEKYIDDISGKGVTLVFDGYDEYPEGLRKNSFLSDVIKRNIFELHSCNIIITSRPSASAGLHNSVDLRVEILGFTKEQRKSYIHYALKGNSNAIQDLLEYLETIYSVDAYCHIPLNMAILVFLFKECDYNINELPATQTAINYKFVCITIRRFIKKSQPELLSIRNLSEVPESHKQILFEISKLAFMALQEDKIVFTANEIKDFCPGLLSEAKQWNGLDLLKAVQYCSLEENADELSFNFLHYSVQELLAAYHISLMSESKQIILLQDAFWNSRFFNAWIMYVALTKDKPFAFKHFLSGNRFKIFTRFSTWHSGNSDASISKSMKNDKFKCLHLFQCFTEIGNDDMCRYISELLQDGKIDLSRQTLSAVKLYNFSLFLARCVRRKWDLLDLSNSFLSDENIKTFCKSYASLSRSTVHINTIDLSCNDFTHSSASQIANLILNFHVKQLILAANEIKDIGIDKATISALLEYPNLVQSRLIEIKDDNQIILILCKKGIASQLFIMLYCIKETYNDVHLCIKNNSQLFEMFLNTNHVSTFKTMVHRLIDNMTLFSTNFQLHVKNISLNTQEIANAIRCLACCAPLTVSMDDNFLPLQLYNISNYTTDNNEIFSNSGTIFISKNTSMQAINLMFCFLLAKNLNRVYLNRIFLYDDYFIKYIGIIRTTLTEFYLVDSFTHNNKMVVNVLSQVINKASFLQHLNLSGCRFLKEHMMAISKALKQVVSFKTIVITDSNLFKEVSDIITSVISGNKALQRIELSNCNLQEEAILNITKALENTENLLSLDLSDNVISDEVAVIVAAIIEKCHVIKDIRLYNCKLQNTGLKKIAEALAKMTCLHYIDLSSNVISDQNAVIISNAVKNNKNLQRLDFSNCRLQNTGCQLLFQAIAKVRNLLYLVLSNNLLTDVTVDKFASMIHQNNSLEYLYISGCCKNVMDFEKITESLLTLKSLHCLDLSCNVTNLASAENIANTINNNAFLEDLNFSSCRLHGYEFQRIITAMQKNQQLKNVCLNSNSIGEEATKIASLISNNPTLEKVLLSNCNLTEKGMKNIFLSLRNHTLLKHFDISSNVISIHAVNELADLIISNNQLTHLDISNSEIQEYGILKIFEAMQSINTLKSIKLCNCTVSNRACKEIANAIYVNRLVEELVFTNNNFLNSGISLLFSVLENVCNLKHLTVTFNQPVNSIIAKISGCLISNFITHFNFSNCDLRKDYCSLIINTLLSKPPVLLHIDLSGNDLSGVTESVAHLVSVNYYLQYLSLANTSMQDDEVTIMVKAMQNINSLRDVDLTSYNIYDELAVELQHTIDNNPAINSFKFSELYFNKSLITIGKSTFKAICNLQRITICFSDWNSDATEAIVHLINNSQLLQYLHLENCMMLEISINSIIGSLRKTVTLEYFCLINIIVTEETADEIANIIESNIQLKQFMFKGCKVTEKGFAKFIHSFRMLNLSHLTLSKMNYLTTHIARQLKTPIFKSVIHLNLSNVHLDNTNLSYLSLNFVTGLKHLNLSHNPIADEGANILSAIILNNSGLEHLDLCDCKLQSNGIKVVTDSLQATAVTYLDMSLNMIDIDIMPLLSGIKMLKHIYFPYYEMKQNEIDKINYFIKKMFHLKFIDFGPIALPKCIIDDLKNIVFVSKGKKKISFSKEGIKQLDTSNNTTDCLFCSLHYLNINNITVNEEIENTVVALIANSPKLECLEMAGCEWNYSSAKKCFKALQNNKNLLHLNLSNICISFRFIEVLCWLAGCATLNSLYYGSRETEIVTLKCLDLSDNYIDDEAIDYLAAVIGINVGLEYLNLCNCGLKSSSIETISNSLKLSSSLKCLDLSLNELDSKALYVDQVVALLASNKHLEELKLHNLVLKDCNLYQLQSLLLVIKGLKHIIIGDSFFTDKDASIITSLIANNSMLHEICLLNCNTSLKGAMVLSSIATALYMQCLKVDKIVFTNPTINKSITHTKTSLDCSASKFNLGNDDVVAVITADNNLGELIMLQLILNQDNLKVLSTNTVTIRGLTLFHIKECIFTDYYAHYVAYLITANAATIQSFSLTTSSMTIKQKAIVYKAICKLNIILLRYLKIGDLLCIDEIKHEKNEMLKYCFTKCNSKLTNDIITATVKNDITLKISKLCITKSTLVELRKTLRLCKGLIINLKFHHCKFHDEDVINVATIINNNDCIQEFTLYNCILSQNYIEMLNALKASSTLLSLKFININFIRKVEDLIIIVIEKNPGLSHFAISRCDINQSGLVKIMRNTAKHLKNLLYINFSHFKFSREMVNLIETVIIRSSKWKHIDLCNCGLLTAEVNRMIQAAKSLTTLDYFDLSHNCESDLMVNYQNITNLIANNKNITTLNMLNFTFSNNHFKVITIDNFLIILKVIAILIDTDKCITALSFKNDALSNYQLHVFSNAIKRYASLAYIDLKINEINCKSIIDVAAIMENSDGLKESNVQVTKLILTESMMQHLSGCLSKFRGIFHLSIVGCTFDFEEWNILKQLVVYNVTINTLTLSDCQLCSGISKIAEICKHATHLNLSKVHIIENNKLNNDPTWLPTFNKVFELKTIYLDEMNITEETTIDILSMVHSSKNLELFTMVNCNINRCDNSALWKMAFLECKSLLQLDLSYSKISGEIAAFMLAHSKNITHIKMASCNFDTKGILSICDVLRKHYAIEHLNLNSNVNVSYCTNEISAIIKNNKNLMHIEMAACNFDKDGIIEICKYVALCRKIQHINLSHNDIIGHTKDTVVSMLSSSKCLKYINLQKCGLMYAGSRDIIMALANCKFLKSVDLSLNEMADCSVDHVGTMIANNKNIEILYLPDYNEFTSSSHVRTIKSSLTLKNYSFSSELTECILDATETVKSLKHIKFSSNQVNDKIAGDVAALTAGNAGLVQLKFSDLILTNSGFKQLGWSTRIMKGLNNISITGVDFTNFESCYLATLISNNKELQSFDISNCVISEKGKNIVLKALINLECLKSLKLKNIIFKDTLEDKVLNVIANNINLQYLEITGCKMDTLKLMEVVDSFNGLKIVNNMLDYK